MPKWVEDCVKRVKKENPGYSDSKAWAICQDQYKKKVKNEIEKFIKRVDTLDY